MEDRVLTLAELLQKVVSREASDLHLTPHSPPRIRIHGRLDPLNHSTLQPADTKRLAYSVMTDEQKFRHEQNMLYLERKISFEDSVSRSSNPDELLEMLTRSGAGIDQRNLLLDPERRGSEEQIKIRRFGQVKR